MILNIVEDGKMLSCTWEELSHDQYLRSNLFTGLARTMLSLSRESLPRIRSLTIDGDGVVSLTNRPLGCPLQRMENDGASSEIPRDLTYSTADTYYSDILSCHSQRIRYVPNSINDTDDGQLQLGILALMRSVSAHFTDCNLRGGPFVLMLIDTHQSNIFVDIDWNITAIIDLEWACVRPLEMLQPPSWLSGKDVDELTSERLATYDTLRQEFMRAFEREEMSYMHDFQRKICSVGYVLMLVSRSQQGWGHGKSI